MATYAPIDAIREGHTGRGGSTSTPKPPGGGDDGRGSDSGPNYGARLRRARLGLICGVATVTMVFVSLTSAYIVRQGLPTYDEPTGGYSRVGGGRVCPGGWGAVARFL